MKKVLLLKFGELFLKGKNKKDFENLLVGNIRKKLADFSFKLAFPMGRIVISDYDEFEEDMIVKRLTTVFGLIGVSKATELKADKDEIFNFVSTIKISGTFRVNAKRADKKFPLSSMELERELGAVILENNKEAEVDLHNPKYHVNVEVRFNDLAYVYYETIKCAGGLPLGSAGKALLLLSGGIDSPVAGYLMAKRGLKIEAVHFHSYPYTSEQAKEKVITLAKELCEYCDEIKLHIVSFTKIQEQIHMNCDPEYMITIMRRIMMRIAEKICNQNDLGAIITGESLGQVASQTMQSINVTNSVVSLPVFRPVIAFDKEDIVEVAEKIGTFETSILPYEDCCTVFLPKYPVIKPTIKKAEYQEKFLNIENLVDEALSNQEEIVLTRE
mgnify:FL=1